MVEVVSVNEQRIGLGNARNLGLSVARGEIIAFTDDDCYPAENFLETTCQCFEEDARLGFVGGRILLHDPTDYPITIQKSEEPQHILPGAFIPAGLIQGANFSFRSVALRSVGGFDPRFGAGTRFCPEDIDALARLSACGWHGRYDPRPLVYHHHRRKTRVEADRLMRQYDRGRGAYYAKCILNPTLRWAYARAWYRRMRQQDSVTTWREIFFGIEFLLRNLFQRAPRQRMPSASERRHA